MESAEAKLIMTALRQQQALNKTLNTICENLRKERDWYKHRFEDLKCSIDGTQEREIAPDYIDLTGSDAETENMDTFTDKPAMVPKVYKRKRVTAKPYPKSKAAKPKVIDIE